MSVKNYIVNIEKTQQIEFKFPNNWAIRKSSLIGASSGLFKL